MKLLISCILFFFISDANAQFNQNSGHVWLKTGFGHVDSANLQTYGVSGEFLVHERLGLNYNLEFVHRNDNIYQIHTSAGLLLGPPLILFGILSSNSTSVNNSTFNLGGLGVVAGIILLVAPDGISYHIPVKYNWDIAPYANFLGVDFMKNNNSDKWYLRYSGSYGCKVTYWQESGLTFNAFSETRKVAGMGWSFGGGFGIGYAWE
jgi:hypothetical protein